MLNPEEFLNATTTEALDTHLDPCPAGEYIGVIDDVQVHKFVYKSGENEGKDGYRLALRWEIQDDAVKQALSRDKVSVMQSLLLDLTATGDGLDMGRGKNVRLGQIRDAVGQNVAGQPWNPKMLEGGVAKVKVKNGVYNDLPNAEIEAVRKAA